MAIAKLTVEVAIAHAQSIKDRRQVVRSLKDKLRHGFNVSVAEMDDAKLWNRATLGVVAISGSTDYLTGQMREVDDALAPAVQRAGGGDCGLVGGDAGGVGSARFCYPWLLDEMVANTYA